MIQLSPLAGTEADFGDFFINFSMETSRVQDILSPSDFISKHKFSDTPIEEVMEEVVEDVVEDAPEVGFELEVETDASPEVLTLTLPQETLLMIPQKTSENVVEVQSSLIPSSSPIDYTVTSESSHTFSAGQFSTLNEQELYTTVTLSNCSQSFYADSSQSSSSSSLACDPEKELGTLPIEATSLEMSLADQSASLEDVTCPSPASLISEVSMDGEFDEELTRAAMKAVKTGKMTSLIKEEVRCLIQSKRLQDGKEELEVEEDSIQDSVGDEHLSNSELEKRRIRRVRNRLAAQKCRQRKKDRAEDLEQEVEGLMVKNKCIEKDIKGLVAERDKLVRMLRHHDVMPTCGRRLSAASDTADS